MLADPPQWYLKEEQISRASVWFSFNGIAQSIGGFLAYGIVRATEKQSSHSSSWRWLYLATGVLTVLLGIVFYWYMPDNQLNARWMSEEDRVLAVHRIRGNQQGIGNKHFKRYQLIEALQDPMTWAFTFYACVTSIGGGGLSGFFSQMVSAPTRMEKVVTDSSIGQSTRFRHSRELPSRNSCRRGVESNLRFVRIFWGSIQEAAGD